MNLDSKNFLPNALKEVALFSNATELIDEAFLLSEYEEEEEIVLDPLISALITQYHDAEALQAYYNVFIKPIIGTATAIRFLLDLMDFTSPAQYIEWHEMDWPMPKYKVVINFKDVYPEIKDPNVKHIDWDKFIDCFNLIKNERLVLSTITMEGCANILCTDYGVLDKDFLDDTPGYKYRGINFCLYEKHNQGWTDFYEPEVLELKKGVTTGDRVISTCGLFLGSYILSFEPYFILEDMEGLTGITNCETFFTPIVGDGIQFSFSECSVFIGDPFNEINVLSVEFVYLISDTFVIGEGIIGDIVTLEVEPFCGFGEHEQEVFDLYIPLKDFSLLGHSCLEIDKSETSALAHLMGSGIQQFAVDATDLMQIVSPKGYLGIASGEAFLPIPYGGGTRTQEDTESY